MLIYFITYQTAFGKQNPPMQRLVKVPAEELTGNPIEDLEKIYQYGQNCNQLDENCYSLSVGDIINYHNDIYIVDSCGFVKHDPDGKSEGIHSPMLEIDLQFGTAHPMVQKYFGYLSVK
jgi:hypothetical protein